MRNTRRTNNRHVGNNGSFWLSFSDLMSSLVLIFVLVMFYIIYQYFNLAEINEAEIARRQYQLDEMQTDLDEQKTKLTDAEQQMISQQILLNAAQNELTDAQAVLESQKSELAAAQSLLTEKEDEIAAQQSQLDAQSTQLNDQQVQIEQLVGLKTRIISSLSTALKENNISATVDPTNGSIALESDVFFESARYDLTERGKSFIDSFLPIYLDVLFSDEYKGYVAEIIIEGHTDSDGGYMQNLQLSQRRALAVANYVLDDTYGQISANVRTQLRQVVTVNGRSFSDPILDANGNEDKDASRRVVFKFRLTDEQMIAQLQQILEANG